MNALMQPLIVIIDDDVDDREMLSSALELHGFKTQSFEEARLAIQALKTYRDEKQLPVMIISDYNMPNINGKELLVLVKSEKTIREIPVVIYSTSISQKLSKLLLELGAYSTIIKAANYQDFLKQIIDMEHIALTKPSKPLTSAPVSLFKPFNLTKSLKKTRRRRLLSLALQELCSSESRGGSLMRTFRRSIHRIKSSIY